MTGCDGMMFKNGKTVAMTDPKLLSIYTMTTWQMNFHF